jgi:segregation and condensation protein B
MGDWFDDDDEEDFDLAAVEARHAELEAQEKLDAEKAKREADKSRRKAEKAKPEEPEQQIHLFETPEGLEMVQEQRENPLEDVYPETDWEAIIEAVLFTMGNSVELRQLAIAIGQCEGIAKQVVENLQKRYEQENRGMQIIALEDSYQMTTRAKYYNNLILVAKAPKKHVLTDVILETLSVVAYKQPVTKAEITRIRGVASDFAVNRLVEYGLIAEVGRLDAPGRPALFATTEEFLRRFGVGSTNDLPTMNPEQEEEIAQEVQEELQMYFPETAGEAAASDEIELEQNQDNPKTDAVQASDSDEGGTDGEEN